MSADRVSCILFEGPDRVQDDEAILRDLEKIIFETLPRDRAEAYVTSLRQLLNDIKGTTLLPQPVASSLSPSEAGSPKPLRLV